MLSRFAPAKLNLGLHVLRKRPDGFHDLDTVFVPIGWADVLTAEPAGTLTLTTTDPHLPTDDRNLVIRAAHELENQAGPAPGAALYLDKRVPYGAGLGSGSSDAATTLRLLVDLWGVPIPEPALRRIALRLGSDVPFFLDGVAAYGTGRGERLAPLVDASGAPWRCPFWIVVAVPPVHVSTAEAFASITPQGGSRPDLATAVTSDDLGRWRAEVRNDFQPAVEAAHPPVREARQSLEAHGAGYAALSGTGSAVFGVFVEEAAAGRAAAALGRTCRIWLEAPQSG